MSRQSLALRIFLTVAACCYASHAQDWRDFRGGKTRTGHYAGRVGAPQKQLWRLSLPAPVVSSPSVMEDRLYVGCQDSSLYAVDIAKGKIEWRAKTQGWVNSSPAVMAGEVIVGGWDNTIYKIERTSGKIKEKYYAGTQLSSPAVLDDGSMISGLGWPLNSFSVFKPDKFKAEWGAYFTQPVYSSPAIKGNTVVIGANDARLYCINLQTRKIDWQVKTGGGAYLSSPAIDDSVVYFAPGDRDRNIYAARLLDGTILWKGGEKASLAKTSAGRRSRMTPDIIMKLRRMSLKQRVATLHYLKSRGLDFSYLIALSKKSSDSRDYFFPAGSGIKTSSVALDSQNVYVIQKEKGYTSDITFTPGYRYSLLALDKRTGQKQWEFSEIRNGEQLGFNSSPITASKMVFFGWGDGKVYALENERGRIVWEDSLSGNIISSPAIADEKLFIATMEGNLYAYALNGYTSELSFRNEVYAFPNPVRGHKNYIKFHVLLDLPANIKITIYNSAERPVKVLTGSVDAREQKVFRWNLKGIANGIYFAKVNADYAKGGNSKWLKLAVMRR